MNTLYTETDSSIETLARKRANAKYGWYVHATVYLLVNSALAIASAYSGKHWAVFPLLGWGLGLGIHGLAVFFGQPARRFRDHLIAQERKHLQNHSA